MVIKKGNFFNNSSTHSEVEILQNNHDNCGKIRNGYKPKNPLPFQFSDNSTHTPIIEIGRNGYKHKIPVTHKISDTSSHGRDIEFDCGNYSISTSTETGTSNTDCNLSWDYEHDPRPIETASFYDLNSTSNFIRKRWPRRSEFVMMLVGYTIGLGNVWRFPYLCHKNGGASFLIPYFVFLLAEGMPLYYMELSIGQRFRKGSIGVWHRISPYLDGLGIASAIVCLLVCLYYNVILSWCMIYFVNSFKSPLPWSTCPEYSRSSTNGTELYISEECSKAGPTQYFWYRITLNVSNDIESGGEIIWSIALTLLLAWILCWLCMIKGVRSEGKVVFVTATVPLLLLGAMFFEGVQLDGFQQGLALLFVPNFSRLGDPGVWLDAAYQTFYSLGIAYGSLIAFASYNPLKNDTTRDAILLCSIDAGVSVYASVVIFCFIGYRAQTKMNECLKTAGLLNDTNSKIEQTIINDYFLSSKAVYSGLVNDSNIVKNITCNKQVFLNELSHSTGFAFVTFTEAINTLPYPRVWSIIFFMMLVMLGVDTQFGMMEGFITPLMELTFLRKMSTALCTGIACLLLYALSFTMVTTSGSYWLQIFENYCSGIPLLAIALVEVIAIAYGYGLRNLSDDIEYMTNKRPHKIWLVSWKIISPFLLVVVLIVSIRNLFLSTPTYTVWDADTASIISKPLPPWGTFIGVMMILCSVTFIPLVALLRYYGLLDKSRNKNRFRYFFTRDNHGSFYKEPLEKIQKHSVTTEL